MNHLLSRLFLSIVLISGAVPANAETAAQLDHSLTVLEDKIRAVSDALNRNDVNKDQPLSVTAQNLLETVHVVTSQGSPPLPFSSEYIVRCLKGAESTPRDTRRSRYIKLLTQIEFIRSQIHEEVQKPVEASNGESVHALVVSELTGDQYGYDPPPSHDWEQKFDAWLTKVLARLFRTNSPRPPFTMPLWLLNGAGFALLWIFKLAISVIVIVVIVVLVRFVNGRRRFQPLVSSDSAESELLEARDVNSLIARAAQLAQQADYRSAFRLIYLATFVALDTDGILHFDRSKTNWEYLRLLREGGRNDLYQLLIPFTRDFDHIWYGYGVADASCYAQALHRYSELKSQSSGQIEGRSEVKSRAPL